MARAPFQVVVMPFRRDETGYEFAAFRRSDHDCWQGIAGGGEDGESPLQAAIRESREEAGLGGDRSFFALDTMCMVSVRHFAAQKHWPSNLYVIPEYAFAIDATGAAVNLSSEHKTATWGRYDRIADLLHWDSNRTALWELNERLLRSDLRQLQSEK